MHVLRSLQSGHTTRRDRYRARGEETRTRRQYEKREMGEKLKNMLHILNIYVYRMFQSDGINARRLVNCTIMDSQLILERKEGKVLKPTALIKHDCLSQRPASR